jgi:hypothetical protein
MDDLSEKTNKLNESLVALIDKCEQDHTVRDIANSMVIFAKNKHKNVIYSKEQLEVKENEMTEAAIRSMQNGDGGGSIGDELFPLEGEIQRIMYTKLNLLGYFFKSSHNTM